MSPSTFHQSTNQTGWCSLPTSYSADTSTSRRSLADVRLNLNCVRVDCSTQYFVLVKRMLIPGGGPACMSFGFSCVCHRHASSLGYPPSFLRGSRPDRGPMRHARARLRSPEARKPVRTTVVSSAKRVTDKQTNRLTFLPCIGISTP